MRASICALLAGCALALGLFAPPAASACTQRCSIIPTPSNPYCMRCVDTGEYTGAACRTFSSGCGCFYVHIICDQAAAAPAGEETALAELGLATEEGRCSSGAGAGVLPLALD